MVISPYGTRNGETPRVFELRGELILEDYATLLREGNYDIFLKFSFVGEHVF